MKNVSLESSSEVAVEGIGYVKKGWIIPVKDEIADKLQKIGFRITTSKASHEWDKENNVWIEIAKNKKSGGEN